MFTLREKALLCDNKHKQLFKPLKQIYLLLETGGEIISKKKKQAKLCFNKINLQ